MKIIKLTKMNMDESIYVNVSHIIDIELLNEDAKIIGSRIELTNGRVFLTDEKPNKIYDMIKKAENLF